MIVISEGAGPLGSRYRREIAVPDQVALLYICAILLRLALYFHK